jgi:LacI family transcriptional regulator
MRSLVERGRRRMAMIAPPFGLNYSIEMRSGGEDAAREAGVAFEVLSEVTSHDRSGDIQAALAARLGRGPEVDGIICASTTSCMAAVASAEAVGLTLGDQIDVVGKEAIPFLGIFRPAILSFTEDVGEAGTFLAGALLQQIREPGQPPRHHLQVPGPLPPFKRQRGAAGS